MHVCLEFTTQTDSDTELAMSRVSVQVQYKDTKSAIAFSFGDFPFVTIRKLKQAVTEQFNIPSGTPVRILRNVPSSNGTSFEELANNGAFKDFNVQRGDKLVVSTTPLAVKHKNLTEPEMERTIYVFNWVPPAGTTLQQMQEAVIEVFGSFGPIVRIIISSLTQSQQEFLALVIFETREAATSAAAAMQSTAIVSALQEVSLLNKGIGVFTAVRDDRVAKQTAPPSDDAEAETKAAGDNDAATSDVQDGSQSASDVDESGEAASKPAPAAGPDSETAASPSDNPAPDSESSTPDGDAPASDSEAPASDNGAVEPESDASPSTTEPAAASIDLLNKPRTASHAHALQMAKSQLVNGYLDGQQSIAYLKWIAEPIPLRAKMGNPEVVPVSQRVKQWTSTKAKVVGSRVQGAARGALSWFKSKTTRENLNAVKAKIAEKARNAKAGMKTAAKKVASTAAKAKENVKAKLSKSSTSQQDLSGLEAGSTTELSSEDFDVDASNDAGSEEAVSDEIEDVEVDVDAAIAPAKPPANLTFDDI